MVLYDPVYHHPADGRADEEPRRADAGRALGRTRAGEYDRRFVRVKRPVVLTGGELTLDQLDLQYDYHTKMYQAPFQMKANGGVLIVDDFGRQRVPPRDLLNRWIVPLEKRVDFLTLHTGQQVPGAVRLPADLRDQHRAERPGRGGVPPPDPLQDHGGEPDPRRSTSGSSSAAARGAGIAYHPEAVEQVYRDFYGPYSIAPRGCHPRDMIDHLGDIARFLEQEPTLSRDLVERACRSYFLDFPTSAEPRPADTGRREGTACLSCATPIPPCGRRTARSSPPCSARMEEFERDNQRLRRLGVYMLVGVGALLGLAAAFVVVAARHGMPGFVPLVTESRRFVVRDDQGTGPSHARARTRKAAPSSCSRTRAGASASA